mmetsp:Transcript_12364/g.22339  ORF Transcript_12364/g.22339 Transcript_12364/m.22339 type:complete len:420 (-) Transcript_12364:219-1478(-)
MIPAYIHISLPFSPPNSDRIHQIHSHRCTVSNKAWNFNAQTHRVRSISIQTNHDSIMHSQSDPSNQPVESPKTSQDSSTLLQTELKSAMIEFISIIFLAIASYSQSGINGVIGCACGVGAMAYTFNSQMNPAVTLGLLATNLLSFRSAVLNILAQLLGGILGASFCKFILGTTLSPAVLLSDSITKTFALESVISFFLMCVVYSCAIFPVPALAPVGNLCVGLFVVVIVLLGASCNPALAFAKSVTVTHGLINHWIFWFGPIIGCTLGALFTEHFMISSRENREARGIVSFWIEKCRASGVSLRRMGVAGLMAYGLLNTLYYGIAFSAIWLRLGVRAAGAPLAENLVKAWAVTWAGSQITKPLRLGGALALVPFFNRLLERFSEDSMKSLPPVNPKTSQKTDSEPDSNEQQHPTDEQRS